MIRARQRMDSLNESVEFVNETLKKSHVVFRNCLDFQSILPHLRSHELLTDNEWEVISKKDSRELQVDEFLKFLPRKGKNCLQQLIKCLQLSLNHTGHKDILTELGRLVERQSETQSETQAVDTPAPADADLTLQVG